jgi:hypothetical protein
VTDQNSHSIKNGLVLSGLVLLVIGIILLAYVHSMRPPEGLGDAFRMLMDGSDRYFKEPFYSLFMAGSAVIALIGVVLFISGLVKKSR